MVGSGNVVSHGLRRVPANEHRAGVAHPVQILFAIARQMFGGQPVGDLARFVARSRAPGSWSAWATRSAAMPPESPFSLVTTISVGPASMSMAQSKATIFLAAVTYQLPGPTILSTRGIVSVPKARAAIAWAPPTR